MNHILIGIQARLGSTRLPRKTALPFKGDNSLIEYIYINWSELFPTYNVRVLAPIGEKDDEFWSSLKEKCNIYFGDDVNLLRRYYFCAKQENAKIILRVTGDNPFIHPDIINKSLLEFSKNGVDYFSSKSDDGCNIPQGIGVEIFTFEALSRVFESSDPCEQEHVSEAFLNNKDVNCAFLLDPFNAKDLDLSSISLTLDHQCQFDFLKGLK